ncbi:hypothetical protein [Pleomorphovibrio marinus]|uniref:hypothetical protein n=1 Tax=Pleomorphovibrio marinus TaxID=2164132 RepID=UPI000E0C529E|nr:hypothetical protein [Pleomorphovibrio marinus]
MEGIFKKLNYSGQNPIHILNAPASFEPELLALKDNAEIITEATGEIHFVLAFLLTQEQVDAFANVVCPMLQGDAVCWAAYPKKSSKKFSSDINRDKGWDALGKYQMEPVRQVAIDEDWSALRFRKVAYIKNLKRKFGTISEEGKKKTNGE